MKYKNPFRKAYLYPLLASVPMAAAAGVVYYGLYVLIHSNVICLGISIICAVAVYLAVYLYIARPSMEELSALPGGGTIYALGKRFHLC